MHNLTGEISVLEGDLSVLLSSVPTMAAARNALGIVGVLAVGAIEISLAQRRGRIERQLADRLARLARARSERDGTERQKAGLDDSLKDQKEQFDALGCSASFIPF